MLALLPFLYFCLCLYPVTAGTVSVNYVFALAPLPLLLLSGKLHRPPAYLLAAMSIFIAIFCVASLYQLELAGDMGRRFVSFALFMTIFAFAFVEVDEKLIATFKRAVIVMSVAFSLHSIYMIAVSGGTSIGFEAKNLVGSQRYGFIYLVGFWCLYTLRVQNQTWRLAKSAGICIILIGLALTFSRASIVALVASFVLHILISTRRIRVGTVIKALVLTLIGVAIVAYLIATYFPVVFQFFDTRLLQLVMNRSEVAGHLSSSTSSEGARLTVWAAIMEFVLRNPLTGAGFLGVWIISGEDTSGLASAHNQYMDIIFRTGLTGFLCYLTLLVLISRQLWRRRDMGLFTGFMSVLLYGMFHETFKESQGGFLLAFMIGMLASTGRAAAPVFSGSNPGLRQMWVRLVPSQAAPAGLRGSESRSRP